MRWLLEISLSPICLARSINMTRLPWNQIKPFHLFQRVMSPGLTHLLRPETASFVISRRILA